MADNFTHVVAIGASAGGIQAIGALIEHLPKGFPAPVVIALHSSETLSLPDILARRGALPVKVVENEETLAPGQIYVCPGGRQSRFNGRRMLVSEDQMGERFRPSVDLLFESLAEHFGPNGIAVVMSGMLNDGTDGALRLNQMGATMLVQSPEEARYESMPSSVILNDHPEQVLPAAQIAKRLVEVVGTA